MAREHITSMDCWCHPTRDAVEPNVIVHNRGGSHCPECDTEYLLSNIVTVPGGVNCKCLKCGAVLFVSLQSILSTGIGGDE